MPDLQIQFEPGKKKYFLIREVVRRYIASYLAEECPILNGGDAENVDAYLGSVPAWFCENDEAAYAFMGLCDHKGLKVGRDVAVAAYDDLPQSAMPSTSLTSVNPRREEVGIQAFCLVQRLARGEDVENIALTPILRTRGSCGCSIDDGDGWEGISFGGTLAGNSLEAKGG